MNVAQARDRITGHTTGLIMHWIDECGDPAHKIGGGSTVATNPHSHQDQLVAVWIEESPAPPPTAH
jgi:hypothetical protein